MIRRFCCALLVLLGLIPTANAANEWLKQIPLEKGRATIDVPSESSVYFLRFAGHSFAPDEINGAEATSADDVVSGEEISIGPFQELAATRWRFPARSTTRQVEVAKLPRRDRFWDQIITVDQKTVGSASRYTIVEAGKFGTSLPPHVRDQQHSADEIRIARQSLVDPVISALTDREVSWHELEAAAFPLDFQKVLLASCHDAEPAFAFQNGQWLTTWLSRDLPKWTKEDHWFAPALLIGDKLVRPAPLAAKTAFIVTETGVTVPAWTLEWTFQNVVVHQQMFSHRETTDASPRLLIEFRIENLPHDAKLALGMGRRPNCHYWDDTKRDRTPIPFFTLQPKYRREGRSILDESAHVILSSAQDFELETLGPMEMLATFDPDSNSCVYLTTPQTDTKPEEPPFTSEQHASLWNDFERQWSERLRTGAVARLPSSEWMRRIDIWQSQVAAITRVRRSGEDRLNYGAYFYQSYFGPEEGWPIVALAQWGRGDEAKRQSEIMLSAENREKTNVHHQSRNGTAAWYAASVARLSHDGNWLESIAPALVENAEWTIAARKSTENNEAATTRGLLPAHIYGGDIRDPATSLYASAVCCKGLFETADVFRALGTPELVAKSEHYEVEAKAFKKRLAEVLDDVVEPKAVPPFLPLALALPSLQGRNEGPYERLTESRLGNYWNLFAPSVLELGIVADPKLNRPNSLLLATMEQHGGCWAGLPRFNAGLDAAYSIGVIRELLRQSASDVRYRNQALATLQSFFLHAASRNGYTIPEVAGLFPYRLDRAAYEQLVRESPWSFGMYDADRYLGGHISFTEPLGAGAGEALWLIREALVNEALDDDGLANGKLHLLSTVPSDWFAEGEQIELRDFPTAYGIVSLRTRSQIDSESEVQIEYHFEQYPDVECREWMIRIAPQGRIAKDIRMRPEKRGSLTIKFD